MSGVLIRGQGVAARCCAHLLDAAGIRARVESAGRPRLPAILLGERTQRLISDVFGRADLFAGLPQIEQRVVAWGTAAPATLPHRAAVISEEALSTLLGTVLAAEVPEPDWTILASPPLPASCVQHHFGTRMATALPVTLKKDAAACWIESLPDGWLFLIAGWLLAVGGPVETLLAESRLVAARIADHGGAGPAFPAHPRIASPLCGPGWLSCGTAALSFDPICGDGVGNAIREGILAAAVIRAGGADPVRAHYANRLMAGFERHLQLCRGFYQTGGDGPWWRAERNALDKGIEWCRAGLEGHTFRYRLMGYELQPV